MLAGWFADRVEKNTCLPRLFLAALMALAIIVLP